MSDKHLQTRKSLAVHTGIFGVSSLVFLGKALMSLIAGGFGFWGILAAVSFVVSAMNFRGAWKGFADMDYSKANSSGLISSLTALAAAMMSFM
jgi:hypothetical protein